MAINCMASMCAKPHAPKVEKVSKSFANVNVDAFCIGGSIIRRFCVIDYFISILAVLWHYYKDILQIWTM